jgi:hypothetical protein
MTYRNLQGMECNLTARALNGLCRSEILRSAQDDNIHNVILRERSLRPKDLPNG